MSKLPQLNHTKQDASIHFALVHPESQSGRWTAATNCGPLCHHHNPTATS